MTPEQKQIADLKQRLYESWIVMDSIADAIEAIAGEMRESTDVAHYIGEMKRNLEAFKGNVI